MGKAGFKSKHFEDANGAPDGGQTFGNGFAIAWQRGPLGRHVSGPGGCCMQLIQAKGAGCVEACTRTAPNGAFVEDVLAAVADRIEYYQTTKFICASNARALLHIGAALAELNNRTQEREARKVEGTHDQ